MKGSGPKIARTIHESEPAVPERVGTSRHPNIVIIYMDDMGYSDPGCFGSEIETPHIDRLAFRGLRYNHYTTHPLCSPARAAILTGKNAHAVGSGWLPNNYEGFPGYTGEIPLNAATLAETLRSHGYATIMTGKWHNTPEMESKPSGSKSSWPSQRGFDSFYGVLQGELNYFKPARLMLDNSILPVDRHPEGYYSTDDWTDRGIQCIRDLRSSSPSKPFFFYLANNAVHSPFQAKKLDIEKYRGVYSGGWDAIREERLRRQKEMGIVPEDVILQWDPKIPRWSDVAKEDRRLFAVYMETYAAMLDCVDQNVGKLVSFIDELGELEDTIIVFTSDNGATESGGCNGTTLFNRKFAGLPFLPLEWDKGRIDKIGSPNSASLYPAGWGQVCNTPFPTYKTYTGAGGRRVSFVISCPKNIPDPGGIRRQFIHVTDVMPTLLDLANLSPVASVNGMNAMPLDGISFAGSMRDKEMESARKEQYYECWSNRGYYKNGWFARSLQILGDSIDMDNWTLHDLNRDFSESVNLADQYPLVLKDLVQRFDEEAWSNQVYPLDNRSWKEKSASGMSRAWLKQRRFLPGSLPVHRSDIIAMIADRDYRVTVNFHCENSDEGILWAIGDQVAGVVVYIEDGVLNVTYNAYGELIKSRLDILTPGDQCLIFEFDHCGGRKGRYRMILNREYSGDWVDVRPTLGAGMLEGLDVGIDRHSPVDAGLQEKHGDFRYSGTIVDVVISSDSCPGPKTDGIS